MQAGCHRFESGNLHQQEGLKKPFQFGLDKWDEMPYTFEPVQSGPATVRKLSRRFRKRLFFREFRFFDNAIKCADIELMFESGL